MIQKTPVPNPDKAPSSVSSWGLRVANVSEWLFMSGHAAVSAEGEILFPGDAAGQARWIYGSLGRLLERAGYSFEDVIRMETTVTEAVTPADRAAMRAALAEVFGPVGVKPVAGTHRVVKSLARPGMLVEIELLAAR